VKIFALLKNTPENLLFMYVKKFFASKGSSVRIRYSPQTKNTANTAVTKERRRILAVFFIALILQKQAKNIIFLAKKVLKW
jgi:hypothetical protein